MAETHEDQQVMLAVYEGEPLARLAAQQLSQEEIPCVVQAVGVGPGGWGMAANLPYALYVLASHESRAREVLDLPASPEVSAARSPQRWSTRMLVLLLIIAGAVVLVLADRLFEALLG